ncbi:helix-hairpin-helix domain-containing protein [Parendozoicomonas sp. Alg238-R29]|uniref:helix-hairpin-helix domain-containing protein n=1 Tax=Parendozoicomonas sp. Alg238-R29 TaxID=2993446 RepID=UPI00248ED809|nr:helix-hairpin-helix domain-containing protein [Parendozoicomonas sp. Alg238-R29]
MRIFTYLFTLLSILLPLQSLKALECPDIPRDLLQQEHQTLLEQIQKHNELYDAGKPEIRDEVYDSLTARQRLTSRCLGIKKPAAAIPVDSRHRYPMGSLNKAEDKKQVEDFLKNAQRVGTLVIVQPKIDGVAAELVYRNGRLIQALTRGQWRTRQGITLLPFIKHIPAIPRSISNNKNEIVIRGELYSDRNNLHAKKSASPRHYVAGLINRSEPPAEELAQLKFFPWQWKNSTQGSLLKNTHQFEEWGFMKTEQFSHKVTDIDSVLKLRAFYGKTSSKVTFPMDGIVLKMNNLAVQERLGHLDGTPYWALAWKFPPQRAVSQIQGINWSVGRTGQVTIILDIAPIKLQGITISNVNAGPLTYFAKRDIAVSDSVEIYLKGAATPVLGHTILRPTNRQPVALPDFSPYNGLSCLEVSASCKEQFIARVKWLTGRNGLSIPQFDQQFIEQLISEEKLQRLSDIFKLTPSTIEQEAYRSLHNHTLSLDQALRALGIPEVGRKKSEWLAKHGKNWSTIQKASINDLQAWLKASEQEAQTIKAYLNSREIKATGEYLLKNK